VVSPQPTLVAVIEGRDRSIKEWSFKDEQEWGKKCFEDLDQRRLGRLVTRTWSTGFLLWEGSSQEEIGKWLKNKSTPWQRRRRLLQVVTGTFPCGQQMLKYGYKRTAACTLCQKAHEDSGTLWNGELPKKTIGNIQEGGQTHETPHDWDRKQVEHTLGPRTVYAICSKDELWEAAKEEEMKIPWKDANEGLPVSEEQYQERFWRRRLDGIGLDTATKELLATEFMRTQDARSNYVERATQQLLRSSTRVC
jgi:hypothetical protein